MNPIVLPVLIPAVACLLALALPARSRALGAGIGVAGALGLFTVSLGLLNTRAGVAWGPVLEFGPLSASFALRMDGFSAWAVALVALLGLCAALYSVGWYHDRGGAPGHHYAWLLLALAGATLVLLADDLLLLVAGWEIVTLALYLFAVSGREAGGPGAAKAFAMLGAGDMALLTGVLLIGLLRAETGTLAPLSIGDLAADPLATRGAAATVAFVLLLAASMAKAGAIPFHSWIPSLATGTNAAVMAFLPGSVDKVLGISLLVRISIDWFLPSAMLGYAIMLLGVVTLLGAVLLALVQHDLRRLLSFHAVSQVGYMMLGIGTGTVVGVIGGVFHMVNNAIYKACLFLGAGELERRTGTTDLGEMGGLGRTFPVTFGAMFVASMAISGIPPFNGFVSKWLVYESCVAAGRPLFLVIALFGSVLTLASFVKVLHSAFWGPRPSHLDGAAEERSMGIRLPLIALATLCVLLGVFAAVPMDRFFGPVAGLPVIGAVTGSDALTGAEATFGRVGAAAGAPTAGAAPGLLQPGALTLLLVFGTLVALFLGYLGNLRTRRVRSVFIGGERIDRDLHRFPGTEFYQTVEEMPVLRALYRAETGGLLDAHRLAARMGRPLANGLRRLHTGRIGDYLAWSLVGFLILLVVLAAGR